MYVGEDKCIGQFFANVHGLCDVVEFFLGNDVFEHWP